MEKGIQPKQLNQTTKAGQKSVYCEVYARHLSGINSALLF
jgi:hypothetical protein